MTTGPSRSTADRLPAPVERSVALHLALSGRACWWGATWATLTGILAAGAGTFSVAWLARMLVVWFVVVPLYGSLWVPLLSADAEAMSRWSEALGSARQALLRRPTTWRARFAQPSTWRGGAQLPVVLRALLVVALAGYLGSGALAVLLAGLVLIALAWLFQGHPPGPAGILRSVLEILVPALVGWLAFGGPVPVPAPVAVTGGLPASWGIWWRANWLFPALALGFTTVFYGATAIQRRTELGTRHGQITAGYLWMVAVLALADRPLGAGLVALLFIVQWPFLARFRQGEVHWFVGATQWLAMAAMAVAATAMGWAV